MVLSLVGGGPAGLEVARVASERGHDVVVYEKETAPGGRVRLQAKLPRMSEIGNVASWLERQIKKTGVRIVTDKEVSADNLDAVLAEEMPDVAVVATGATGARDGLNSLYGAKIPGWQQENVYTYEDVLEGKVGNVRKVLLLDDTAEERVVGVAQLLASQSEQVKLITRQSTVCQSPYVSGSAVVPYVQQVFRCKNLKMIPYSFITEIDGGNVRVLCLPNGEKSVESEVDAVVLMTMFKSNNGLYPLLRERVAEVHLIGDARAPRTIHEAIFEGHRLGRKL